MNRKELIEAVMFKNIKKLKSLSNRPRIFVIEHLDGKYFPLSANKDIPDKEISVKEIEELKKDKDNVVLFMPEVETPACTPK